MVSFINAQGEASKWYFGANAGLDFSASTPFFLSDGQLSTDEGCATISESNGNLLFYTDGVNVWNKLHNIMPNGSDLTGDASSTQSAIIVPKPGSSSIYYIFTVDDSAGPDGFRYSEVDMNLNNGNGAVTDQKNIELNSSTTEKISAIKHSNGIDYWVVTHDWNNNDFISYRVTPTGVITSPITSSVGQVHGNNAADSKGYLKISPDGTRLAYASWTGSSLVEIFDFNNLTGEVSNPILINNGLFSQGPGSGAYGIEFSPNSQLLYVTSIKFIFGFTTSKLYQLDLSLTSAEDIVNSVTTLYDDSSESNFFGALQLGIDGKIYMARSQEQFLDVIENPDTIGLGAGYQAEAVSLGNTFCGAGLPPFIASFFSVSILSNGTCLGQSTEFTLNTNSDITSANWDFGDGSTSTEINPTHFFENPGIYTISVEVSAANETLSLSSFITIYEFPIANMPDDMYFCDDTSNDGIEIFDLSLQNSLIYNSTSEINITYHLTENEATNSINSLDVLFENTSSPQTIYARVQNNSNPDCFDITSFNLYVFQSPLINDETVYLCTNESLILNLEEEYDFYNWSTGETTPSITVDSPGIYTVEVNNVYNTSQEEVVCLGEKMFTVIESNEAIITSIEVEDWTNTSNSISVFVDGIGAYEFSLDGLNYQDSNLFTNLKPGSYIVYVNDKNDCGEVSGEVFLLHHPNFFTPNGDNHNAYWRIEFSDSEPDLEILIYDRYGKLLKKLGADSIGWDGTYNGKEMPTSDYWFTVIRPSNGKTYSGHFTLKR